ncbi:hypothetical protein AVEN_88514-1 [Araneus ventricosus]|uniref:Uncharacterized protein n=1 Tax=Araneus ventricosus TaxID=182803 RepID=A0A4Y2E4P8_ARAVE|nr:hypothetical protein AVEN_88514-1 [Araneus ventricosus]
MKPMVWYNPSNPSTRTFFVQDPSEKDAPPSIILTTGVVEPKRCSGTALFLVNVEFTVPTYLGSLTLPPRTKMREHLFWFGAIIFFKSDMRACVEINLFIGVLHNTPRFDWNVLFISSM